MTRLDSGVMEANVRSPSIYRHLMPFIFILGLAGFASAFSLRAVEPTLNLIAADLHVSLEQAALLSTAFALPYAGMQLVFGPIGDAVGKVRVIRATLLLLSLSLVACALAPSHATLLVARILSGAWAGGIIPVSFALVGDRFELDKRPAALGRILMLVVLGQLIGAAASGVIANALGWRAVFWVSTALTILAAIGVMGFITETAPRKKLSFGNSFAKYREVLRNPLSIPLFVIVFIEGALIFGCFPFVAAHMIDHGFGGALEAGISLGAFGAGGILYTAVVTPVLRRLGLPGMARLGAVMAGVCFMLIAEVPILSVVVTLFAIAGFGFYMIHNTIQIMATELVPTARGSSVAMYATSFWFGQAAGAVAMAQVVPFIGPHGLFIGAGLGLIALSWPAAQLARRSSKSA